MRRTEACGKDGLLESLQMSEEKRIVSRYEMWQHRIHTRRAIGREGRRSGGGGELRKVSHMNANGERAHSHDASATGKGKSTSIDFLFGISNA